MSDLKSSKLIYLKGVLFLIILLLGSGLILYKTQSFEIAFLLVLVIWSASRLYYFMFYVIEKYVDKDFKFASIFSFVMYLWTKKKP